MFRTELFLLYGPFPLAFAVGRAKTSLRPPRDSARQVTAIPLHLLLISSLSLPPLCRALELKRTGRTCLYRLALSLPLLAGPGDQMHNFQSELRGVIPRVLEYLFHTIQHQMATV